MATKKTTPKKVQEKTPVVKQATEETEVKIYTKDDVMEHLRSNYTKSGFSASDTERLMKQHDSLLKEGNYKLRLGSFVFIS